MEDFDYQGEAWSSSEIVIAQLHPNTSIDGRIDSMEMDVQSIVMIGTDFF